MYVYIYIYIYDSNLLKNIDFDQTCKRKGSSVNKYRTNIQSLHLPTARDMRSHSCWSNFRCCHHPPILPKLRPTFQAKIGTNRGLSSDGSFKTLANTRNQADFVPRTLPTIKHIDLKNDRNCPKMIWNVIETSQNVTNAYDMLLWSWLDFSLQQCWAAGSPSGVQRPLKIVKNLASLHLATTTQVGAVVHVLQGGQTQLSWLVSLAHVAQEMILRPRPTRPARQTAVAGTCRLSTLRQSFKGRKGEW